MWKSNILILCIILLFSIFYIFYALFRRKTGQKTIRINLIAIFLLMITIDLVVNRSPINNISHFFLIAPTLIFCSVVFVYRKLVSKADKRE